MNDQVKPKLRFACSQPWEEMRAGTIGRQCGQCDRHVLDFTGCTKSEIVQYMLDNQVRSVCGRVLRDHVHLYRSIAEVTILGSRHTSRNSNIAYSFLAVAGLSLQACIQDPVNTRVETESVPSTFTDSTSHSDSEELDSSSTLAGEDKGGMNVESDHVLVGVIIPDFDHDTSSSNVTTSPEVMPEFPGGNDSLMHFLKQNVVYPKWEIDNNIQGKVLVKFTVMEDGYVTDANIIRSVAGSRNLDSEVLRVMALMPKWKPATSYDRPVKSTFALPFSFRLSDAAGQH